MRFAIFRFIGTKDELKRKLAAMTAQQRYPPGPVRAVRRAEQRRYLPEMRAAVPAVDKENRPRGEGDDKTL